MDSSVASFLLWGGGGGQYPHMYRQHHEKKSCICNLYARASASERLKNYKYFQVSKYICRHTCIQSMQWYGIINDSMTDKTLTLRKIYEYASERSLAKTAISFNIFFELQKFFHLLILKLLFPSIFCLYFRYFVSETYIFSGLQLHLHT